MSATIKRFRPLWWLFALTLVSSCAREPMVQESETQQVSGGTQTPVTSPARPREVASPGLRDSTVTQSREQGISKPKGYVSKGSGVFLNQARGSQAGFPRDGDVTLNFEAADLHEIIKVVFEEILEANYLIDPRVQGVATIHTTRSIPKENVLVVLESVLQTNGAALVKEADIYKILPVEDARREITIPTVGNYQGTQSTGFGTHVVPLNYVSAAEMKKLLESVSKESATSVQVDAARNILILSGTRGRIANLMETIRIFDVDWLKGMSFALFPLQYADPKILSEEISKMLGGEAAGPLAGIVQLIPMERLNSVMVITHRPQYLEEARKLIEQFDRGTDTGAGRRLYVYHLKNGKAENIATLLQDIFGQQAAGAAPAKPSRGIGNVRPASATTTAPGIPAASAGSSAPAASTSAAPAASEVPTAPAAMASAGGSTDEVGMNTGEITIIADQTINAILVLSTPQDYRVVESAIRQLDSAPHQVLIEATIAEVRLSDNLSYGVRWFFNDSLGNDTIQGGFGGRTPISSAGGSEGFSLGIFDSLDQMKAFFDILQTETDVKFLSAPQVMVLDNQTANIRVGDQVPIVTRSSQGITDSNAPIVSEVQFRDTGTLLSVTPRVNTGGLVTLEISQEVSIPGTEPAVGGGGNVPIAQRTIDSTVMIQSGQTVVLGGLIRESSTSSNGGIPGLKDLPLLGVLFSSTTQDVSRTELIVTITPRVVTNPMEAREITEEFRKRVKAATDLESSIKH